MTSNSRFNSQPMTVAKAIQMSWISLRNPAVLVRILIPFTIVATFCVGFLYWGWPLIELEFIPFLNTYSFIPTIFGYLDTLLGFSLLTVFAIFLFMIFTFIFTYIIYLILTSFLLVPLLNSVIQKIYFPDLEKRSEMSLFTSIKNSIISIIIFVAVLVILFPFLLIPGGQIVLPYFLNAYISKRIFPFDVLQDYASLEEFKVFRLKENKSLWALAFVTGGYFYVPILNFIAAPLTALGFVFFGMGKIQEYRR